MEKFTKPSLTYAKQVELLQSRGLAVPDPAAAERYLKQISYYRFSAYCLPFEVIRHQFKRGVTFEQIIQLYEFDRRLRFLIDEALEVIEISVRAITSHEMAQKYGPFFHEEPQNFFRDFDHAAWVDKVHDEARRSREIFIAHYKRKYEGFPRLPIWIAVEIMSFGSISLMIDHLKKEDQLILARQFGLHTSILMSWLHTLAYVRNICAHHARLWDRKLAIAMVAPKHAWWQDVDAPRIGAVLLAINQFLYRLPVDNEIAEGWQKEIEGLFGNNPEVSDFWASMGLPGPIQDHILWREKA